MQNDDNADDSRDEPQPIKIGDVTLEPGNDDYVPSEEDKQTIDTLQSNEDASTEDPLTITNEYIRNGIESGKPGHGYYIIGIITVIFGFMIGVFMFVNIINEDIPIFNSGFLLVVTFGLSMLFIVPGTICIGVAKIIKLLDK